MMPGSGAALRALVWESLADALRRRVVPVIVVLALLSLLFVDSCTSCQPTVVRDGEVVELTRLAGVTGLIVVAGLGLWIQVLAGVLASDHLAEPLADGSASLVLARPVSRPLFALTRLAGVLLLALGTGAILIGASGWLLAARQGLPLAPLPVAGAACAVAAATVAALAMALSLSLPRTPTALLVFGLVWGIAGLDVLAGMGAELGGVVGAFQRYGPPLASPTLAALAPWLEEPLRAGDVAALAVRAGAWLAASVGLLVAAFARLELR